LKNDEESIEKIKDDLLDTLNYLPIDSNIKEIKAEKEFLNKLTYDKEYWENLSYDDVQEIIKRIAPLMVFKRSDPVTRVELDIEDVIKQRKLIEFGPLGDEKQEYVEVYKKKVEDKIKELTNKHPTIKKIKNDELISDSDLEKLEDSLNAPELFITEETLQKLYGEHKGTLVEFIKKILGLYKFPDSKDRIEEAFRTFTIELNNKMELSSEQINFIRTLKTVFSAKKNIEYKDLFEPPFTNIPNAPVPLFKKQELQEILVFCNGLVQEVKK
jgi:type I restriction enzyme R subunit